MTEMTKTKILVFLYIMINQSVSAQFNIIPKPVDVKVLNTTFILSEDTHYQYDRSNRDLSKQISLFQSYLKERGIGSGSKNTGKAINISIKEIKELGAEGYKLMVHRDKIELSASDPAGIFNGFQTLKQLIRKDSGLENTFNIPGCEIFDYPRFVWRGLMLDVSRHFFTVEEIKAYLDKMSEYKFNVFHWHLTDDQGWRIEIKSFPKLTGIGAWRVERFGCFGDGRSHPKEGEKATYGGFYTREQIKDIVAYAAERNIRIVPEIDMPGHSMAALAAYPELSVNKKPAFVIPGSKFTEWFGDGKFKMNIENTLNPTDEKVYDFVDKVFTEVAQLFPGDYIHMGGDEAYHEYWEQDPGVQKFMKENKIKNGDELQSYFVKRVEKIINSKGKKMIGWDEIIEGGLAQGATVMSWRGMKGGIKAAKMKHDVVMSPINKTYLNITQGDLSVEKKVYAHLSLEETYGFDPLPDEVDPAYVLGGQGNLWTEEIPAMSFAFYMTYPRAFALVETFWSRKDSKDWSDFIRRTQVHFDRFEAENFSISKAVLEPIVKVYKENGRLMCELKNSIPNSEIYYTIDNTYPVKFGKKYSKPFEIPPGDLDLRTQTLLNGRPMGRELHISGKELVNRIKS